MTDASLDPPQRTRVIRGALLGIVVLAAVLRVPGMLTDMWIDELWSLQMIQGLDSPLGILTALHHDSNHWLNSLWLYLLGSDAAPWAYRLLSFAAGLATVMLAGLLGRRRGRLEGLLALLLTAVCYPLVFYSSEARGYAPMLALVLAAWLLLQRYADGGRPADRIGYWACITGAILAHLTAISAFAGFLAWSLWTLRQTRSGSTPLEGSSRRAIPSDLLWLHVVPLAAMVLLWWIDLRHLQFGGGPRYVLHEVLLWTVSLTVGGPAVGWGAGLAAGVAVAALVVQLRAWQREEGSVFTDPTAGSWVFYATAIVGFPAVLTLMQRPPFLFPRYYLIGILLFQLVLASLLAHVLRDAGRWRPIVVLAGLCLIGAHLIHLSTFWTVGRGGYGAALERVVLESEGPGTTLGSDHDFRNQLLVEAHAPGGPLEIDYLPQQAWTGESPEWYVAHVVGPHPPAPEPHVRLANGAVYVLLSEGRYPSSGLSGATWDLYRRASHQIGVP